jgi:hypothetical protein
MRSDSRALGIVISRSSIGSSFSHRRRRLSISVRPHRIESDAAFFSIKEAFFVK